MIPNLYRYIYVCVRVYKNIIVRTIELDIYSSHSIEGQEIVCVILSCIILAAYISGMQYFLTCMQRQIIQLKADVLSWNRNEKNL